MKPHVLVVDDAPEICRMLSFILDWEGYPVSTACHGGPALVKMFASADPLVVLLGLNMPRVDGAQVLEWVAANSKIARRHRIIMVTGATERASTGRVAELRQQLGVPLIAKPWNDDQILAAVAQAAAEIESRNPTP